MKVWIDRQGGRHYHKENCVMVKEPRFSYQPIEKKLRIDARRNGQLFYRDIKVDGKVYRMCPGCFRSYRR